MVTIVDTKWIYSTIYDKCDPVKKNCLQKYETIAGEPSKKIKISEVSLFGAVAAKGATGTATITAKPEAGNEVTIATFDFSGLQYEEKSKAVNLEADSGQSVTINWYLKTSNPNIRVRIKSCSYSYDLVPTENQDTVQPKNLAYLLIPCATESDALDLKNLIQSQIKDIEIYVKQ